jgi:tRNA dimethylallyltransferase
VHVALLTLTYLLVLNNQRRIHSTVAVSGQEFYRTTSTSMTLPKALRPIIAICGSTGVGKSKLAVELALDLTKRLNRDGWNGGVVVNADSMQTYKGFNTLTNKIPLEERAGVDHVLMDFKEPTEQYSIGQWVHDATQAVSSSPWFSRAPFT